MSGLPPWVPDTDCETHEWRSSTGEVIRFVTMVGATQRMMPPVSLQLLKVPLAQGARYQGARHEARLVTLPVVFPGPDPGRDELRRWARALDPLKGEGTLTVVQGAHPGRQLICAYEAGLDSLSEDYAALGMGALGFRAADPYWQDATEYQTIATLDTSRHWFPMLPLIFGMSDIFAAPGLTNPGDVTAWPTITVTGPGSGITVTNTTTGAFWEYTEPLGIGSTLVVDHRPGHKQARMDGANAFGNLSLDSSLWGIEPGTNRIEIRLEGGTTASQVSFVWRSRWLAA